MAAAPTGTTPREVSRTLIQSLLDYVEHAGGPDVAPLTESWLSTRSGDEGPRQRDWWGVEEAVALAELAAEVCHDAEIGRRAGQELFRHGLPPGAHEAIAAAYVDVQAGLEAMVASGNRLSSGRPQSIAEVHEDHVIIEAVYERASAAHPFMCGFLAGFHAEVPSLYGFVGTAVEVECMGSGSPTCRYRIGWRPDTTLAVRRRNSAATGDRNGSLWGENLIARFEELQSMASKLVAARDVDAALEKIVDQVSRAVRAQYYVLCVELDDSAGRRVHARGFDAAGAEEAADLMMNGDLKEEDGIVVVEVASGERRFGRLAAYLGLHAQATAADERLLRAYAEHAASVLEIVSALDRARRDRDTAQAFLDLAGSLAEVGTTGDIADRLAGVIPAVSQSDVATVWLFDDRLRALTLEAFHDISNGYEPGAVSFQLDAMPALGRVVESRRPHFLDADSAPQVLVKGLAALGVVQIAVAPIISRRRLLGLVGAGFRAPVPSSRSAEVLDRLLGLADQAATAFENARLFQEAQHQALHDRLTGLPNRPLVEDRAKQAFAAGDRDGTRVAMLFIDLDRFKNVNDTLGHRAGDDLICQAAERMRLAVRGVDTLARLGGDEFAVLLPGVDDALQAVAIAERVIAAIDAPFTIAGHEIFISCSIGVACSPEHGQDYESLLQNSDVAMYAAKAAGRNAVFVHSDESVGVRHQQLQLESELHKAIDGGQLRVLYQPQIDLRTMRVCGAEALVRWQHPTRGLLLPGEFLPMAEESGLIVAIDEYVRKSAFAQARRWADDGLPLRTSVNLSTRALHNPRLADVIASELRSSGVAPEQIELEITDRVVMSDEELPPALLPLKELGVRLAIDDFGTGNSVLGRLHSCHVDTLKIDRSFVQAVTATSPEAPLVKAIVALAHSMEMSVVAEGVETAAQGGIVRRYGCEIAQGFLFSAAIEAHEVELMARGGRHAGAVNA